MCKCLAFILACSIAALAPAASQAEFIISSTILEFAAGKPEQQDVELISRGKENDYILAEVSEVVHPGTAHEQRKPVADMAEPELLVTPDKTVLPPGGRKLMRFVLLASPGAAERIYRVALKPVIRGVENTDQVGLKVLVGYEVLVIVRPASLKPAYTARRKGNALVVRNTGNTNILFQGGRPCADGASCAPLPSERVYAGAEARLPLPAVGQAAYTVWDGVKSDQRVF